jgi:nitroimidazol reductase NimA-like FMN-containing flavoprotein (pyridoxamine 5'-phosphate oxidase superfamily)
MNPEPAPQFTELRSKLLELPRTECLNLLGRTHFGRLAISRGEGAPIVRPLNYVFDPRSQSVIFRTSEGSKLHGLLRAKEAAFEIDGVEPGGRTGWSVVLTGVAEEVTIPSEIRRLDKLGLEVWASGPRNHWVRVRARTVSGRRIVAVAGQHSHAGDAHRPT